MKLTLGQLERELADLKALIERSDLEPVECGGLVVGHYTQPIVMLLRSKQSHSREKTLADTLQKMAGMARQLAAAKARIERLEAVLAKIIAAEESIAIDISENDWIEARRALHDNP